MLSAQVNWVAVVVAAVVNMVLGALWYSPMLFGNAWTKGMGWSKADMEKGKKDMNMAKAYGLMFVGALVMAYVLGVFTDALQLNTAQEGAWLGFWAWLGFVATVGLSHVLFEGKKWSVYLISAGYHLVALLAAGAILATWV